MRVRPRGCRTHHCNELLRLAIQKGNDTQLVLVKFGDDVIASPYEANSKGLMPIYTVYRIGERSPLQMHWMSLGYLKPIVLPEDRETASVGSAWNTGKAWVSQAANRMRSLFKR